MNENDIEKQVDRMVEGVSPEKLKNRIYKELESLSIDRLRKVEEYVLLLNEMQAWKDINIEE